MIRALKYWSVADSCFGITSTASVLCVIEGTTYALCHAKYKTVDVEGTLAPKDLNWMRVTVTGAYHSRPTLASGEGPVRPSQSHSALGNAESLAIQRWLLSLLVLFFCFYILGCFLWTFVY